MRASVLPLWLSAVLLASACVPSTSPQNSPAEPTPAVQHAATASAPADTTAISTYVRKIFADRDGMLWFGTTSDGVARYDSANSTGARLKYFTKADGLGNNWVNAMVQDAQGNIWFATGGGVSRFDGERFTTWTTKDGLASDQVWCLLLDRSGVLWAGTEEGASRFDGQHFTPFPIPAADLSKFPYYKYPKQINAITQDKSGTIWFASNGGGVYKYDQHALTNLSEKDGLCNNFVQAILQDRNGSLWFGTRYGAVCNYNAVTNAFTPYTRKELKGDNVSVLYQQRNGDIWMGESATGLCRYDGRTFTCYNEQDGAGIRVIMSVFEDSNGQLWFGTGAGVYRFDGGHFTKWRKGDALRN